MKTRSQPKISSGERNKFAIIIKLSGIIKERVNVLTKEMKLSFLVMKLSCHVFM